MNDYPHPTFDSTKPHSARVWNYFLGGKDNFAVDRAFGDEAIEIFPEIVEVARADRAFLGRVVRYLAGDVGIRQFLDIGTGLPTVDNTHEVAQQIAPDTRVVYIDNDPLVLTQARALLTSTTEGATSYIEADAREPETILNSAAEILDYTRPIAIMMLGVLGAIADDEEAYAVAARLVDALPSGGYLVTNDGTAGTLTGGEELFEKLRALNEGPGYGYRNRSPEQIIRFFDGLELVEPGLVSTPLWRPDPGSEQPPAALNSFCGVGRKP